MNYKQLVLAHFPTAQCQILTSNKQYFIVTETGVLLSRFTSNTEIEAWAFAAGDQKLC